MQLDFFRRLLGIPFGPERAPQPTAPLAPAPALAKVPAKSVSAGLMLDAAPLQTRARSLVQELGRSALACGAPLAPHTLASG